MTHFALNILLSGILVANPAPGFAERRAVVPIRSPSLVTSHQSLITRQSSYDSVGNRLTSHFSSSYAYDSANRLLEDDTFRYTYDADGNLIEKRSVACPMSPEACPDVTRYTYDIENRLISVERGADSVEYRYDGLGRRIEKAQGSGFGAQVTRYVYDNEDIVTMQGI